MTRKCIKPYWLVETLFMIGAIVSFAIGQNLYGGISSFMFVIVVGLDCSEEGVRK